MFNPIAELLIAIGTWANKANAEIETQSVTVESKIRKFST